MGILLTDEDMRELMSQEGVVVGRGSSRVDADERMTETGSGFRSSRSSETAR
jgi:hypothetical protein